MVKKQTRDVDTSKALIQEPHTYTWRAVSLARGWVLGVDHIKNIHSMLRSSSLSGFGDLASINSVNMPVLVPLRYLQSH